jgi:thiol-disulfide isomerase/thioredoxin
MPMRLGSPRPELAGATNSYNGPVDPGALQGHPVLVHFWAVSCHICHEVMPEVIALRDKYAEQGLKVVGIHMPKQQEDLDLAKVEADLAQYGINHPVLVDDKHAVTEAFQNQFVPAFFLFDKEGNLFFRAAGDKGLANLGPKLEALFGAQ